MFISFPTLVSSHCRTRSQLYHTLLHYKLRLLLCVRQEILKRGVGVRGKSRGEGAGEGEVGSDSDEDDDDMLSESFIRREGERLKDLLDRAGKEFGGGKYEQVSGISSEMDMFMVYVVMCKCENVYVYGCIGNVWVCVGFQLFISLIIFLEISMFHIQGGDIWSEEVGGVGSISRKSGGEGTTQSGPHKKVGRAGTGSGSGVVRQASILNFIKKY
ncbi:hypothetical protein EON65_18305 [archaeon]|nr:MAG: hypothetical protein EON65_18305 [archaeon]